MQHLSPFTCRRLNRLPRLASVWEGDRRQLPEGMLEPHGDGDAADPPGDCILWVDGTQGLVRTLQMVPSETGNEAVVRSLIQAIEHPHSGCDPARPRKVIVKDRELQFFLRGALKDLEIDVDYARDLPLIDEIFSNLLDPASVTAPSIPAAYESALIEAATKVWQDEPWYLFTEQDILAITINRWSIETLYVSILGMADVEYGLLLYRSLDSLRQFRQRVLMADQSPQDLQQAFLGQNCLFLNFEPASSEPETGLLLPGEAPAQCDFGSLHPLEGLRTELAEEEAATLIVALEACHRFVTKHDTQLEADLLKPLSSNFRIPNPVIDAAAKTMEAAPKTVSITVKTLPDVAAELMQQTEEMSLPAATEPALPQLRNDTVPDGALILLTELSVPLLEDLRTASRIYYQPLLSPTRKFSKATAWPTVIVQTTRPKAKRLIEQLQVHGGVTALCFNPGSDPFNQQIYQLALIQTQDESLHLLHEYEMDNPRHVTALDKWQERQVKSQGRCGLVIAAGASGAARGRPEIKHMLALFEAAALPPEQLDLQPLVLGYAADFE
ncbi:MAG: hypothetical protein AAFZ80_05365 [Cyanobacteria bacterium P01_A01_bin.105]